MGLRRRQKPMKTAICALAAFSIFAVQPATAETPKVESAKLERMAEVAKTPKDHVAVAKHYRSQAEQFEQKALKHEAQARKMQNNPNNPMAYKWPAMAGQPWVKERQLAMEARRAAQESLEASERHMRLSVEALADASDKRASQPESVD